MSRAVTPELNHLARCFLCCRPLKTIAWNDAFNDWDAQAALLNATVKHPRNALFPVKTEYSQLFLKWVISNVEKCEHEVNDCVYNELGDVISCKHADNKCYKHYPTECGVISLCESVQIVSEGTTGLNTWQAALALSEWCLANKGKVRNKTIVELGSGLGLVGLTLALNTNASNIVLTDCHRKVLQQLCDNVALNLSLTNTTTLVDSADKSSLFKSVVDKTGSVISVVEHSWGEGDRELAERLQPDLILAADVVYDSALFPGLIACIRECLRVRCVKDSGDNRPELVLVCTERNSSTLEAFLRLLGESCTIIEGVLPAQQWFVWSTETPLRLFHISARR